MSDQPTIPFSYKPGKKPSLQSFGDYEIEGELGRGGMGIVYLALQKDLNRRVALKMLTGHYGADELQRFLEEAETAAGLNHPNILHVYEVGEHEGAPYFSMEFVEGGSLADKLRGELPTSRETAELMISVAKALHHAHQNGVVHRDMKPANVLIGVEGVPKIADFGIAKRLNDDSQLTRTGSIIGTPTYMAPEQAKGKSRHVGPAADIYSLGAILYEMLTGKPPFLPEESETPITVRVLSEEPVSPAFHNSSVPRDLEVICMKCLEKEPRQRYPSAAAFADDLRRFLNDESIHAKPPNRLVTSAKWVRRHPWKFVGLATGVLVVLAALTLLVRWELYQRLQSEYATTVDWTNGVLEPIESVTSSRASQSSSYLRLTRRGRLGPIVKAEVLNPRGHPAVLRRTLLEEEIPIYIEGLTYAQPNNEKLPETTTIDFEMNGDVVREAICRDRNNQVNWRIVYHHASGNSVVGARFENLRGFDAASRAGATYMEVERDSKGHDSKIKFLDNAGKPAANGEGVFGYKIDRDEMGRAKSLVNLGSDGQPMPNRAGLVGFVLKYEQGIRFEPRDAQGQPVVWQGIAAVVSEKDSRGNTIKVSNLRSDGQLVNDESIEWAVQEIKRNERGEVTSRTYFKADQTGALSQVTQFEIGYDNNGYPADIKLIGPKPWHSAIQFDEVGNVTEEKNLNSAGEPIVGTLGFAIRRISYTSNNDGLRVEQTYFDAAGNKTFSSGGYHKLIDEIDPTGRFKRQTMEEHDPSKYKYYRYVTEPEYDGQGRLRRAVSRFEDAHGQLATNADLPYTGEELIYDENDRVVTEWKIGTLPEYFGGPALRIDTLWHANGKMQKRIRQVCDEDRQPVIVSANGNAARYEEDFDFVGQRVRIYETGFNEQIVGFSTREATFAGGNLVSVGHTRADGSRVASVLVVITGVVPPANQPKSAELRPGDVLVSANGKSVTSAYGWVFGGAFQGGTIEVERAGQRIRIDGFVAGTLGVALEDRVKN